MVLIIKFIPAIFAMALVSVSILGCVQGGSAQKGYAKDDDCLFCHASSGPAGGMDLKRYYVNNEEHHVVNVRYLLDQRVGGDFNMPDGVNNEMMFFDRNRNGRPDIDEIRIYISEGGPTLTCASCHREHERSPVHVEHPDDDYLRGTNVSSEMCVTCHRK